ncbi:MAG: rhodanese-like domain-containing protein [Flavobacteriaceae bacterium]
MKSIKYILTLFIVASITSCNSQQKKATDANAVVEVVSTEIFEKIEEAAQLIDIRTPEEYNEGYIKNAVNINFFDDDFMEQMSKLNKDEPLYIYCRSGGRSGRASDKLEEAGFTKVYDLGVGMNGWRKEEKAVTLNK